MKYKIEKELYKHTLLINKKQNELIPKKCSARCVKSTILNQSYYSSYLYVKKYLINNGYIIRKPHYYSRKNKKFKTEHKQVIDHLSKENKKLSKKLRILKNLQNKADYHPEIKITIDDVQTSLTLMNDIFKEIKKVQQFK